MSDIKKRAFRARQEHQELILEACEKNPSLLTMDFRGPNARQKYNEEWAQLSIKLNSLGFGEKCVDKWKRVLSDWLTKVKTKYSQIKKNRTATGGEPNFGVDLTDLEERLLALKGYSSVEGDNVTKDAGLANLKKSNSSCNSSDTEFAGTSATVVNEVGLTHKRYTKSSNSTENAGTSFTEVPNSAIPPNSDDDDDGEVTFESLVSHKRLSTIQLQPITKRQRFSSTPTKSSLTKSGNLDKMNEETLNVLNTINNNIIL